MYPQSNITCDQASLNASCGLSSVCSLEMLNILPIYLCKCSSGFIVINDLCGSTQCLDANGLVCGGDASLCNVASGTCGDSPVVKSSSNLGLIIGIIAGLLLLLLLCLLITYLEEEIEVKGVK